MKLVIEQILAQLVYKSIEVKRSEGESRNEQLNKVLTNIFFDSAV
jgi:hypothetical protein